LESGGDDIAERAQGVASGSVHFTDGATTSLDNKKINQSLLLHCFIIMGDIAATAPPHRYEHKINPSINQ
jgi:hypothetical protein